MQAIQLKSTNSQPLVLWHIVGFIPRTRFEFEKVEGEGDGEEEEEEEEEGAELVNSM